MVQPKLLLMSGVLAVVALTAGGTRSAIAVEVEVNFGGATLSGCMTHAGDSGAVCANQSFTEQGISFTAAGYSGQFATATALTQKTGVGNDETGLGENPYRPGDRLHGH